MYIETYEYKGYKFSIYYNPKDNLYIARAGTIYTYDTDLEGLKNKIIQKVYQNNNFKLSVEPTPIIKSEKQKAINRCKQRKGKRKDV